MKKKKNVLPVPHRRPFTCKLAIFHRPAEPKKANNRIIEAPDKSDINTHTHKAKCLQLNAGKKNLNTPTAATSLTVASEYSNFNEKKKFQ